MKVGLFFIFFLTILSKSYCQNSAINTPFAYKVDSIIWSSRTESNSLENSIWKAEMGNSVRFMDLCYDISALTNLYKYSGNLKYIDANFRLIDAILQSGEESKEGLIWIARSDAERFKRVNNTEVILFEGYIFKHILEFLYTIRFKSDIYNISSYVQSIEKIFFKWYNRSLKKYGDDSLLFGVRTHIGANWALTALLLNELTKNENNKTVYRGFIKRYDTALKNNLIVNNSLNGEAYFWNSTWDFSSTKLQKTRKNNGKDKNEIQDVTHANHVVHYIITSYLLETGEWSNKDIFRLINSLKYKIWINEECRFTDLVNGKYSIHKSLNNTGWKQSDGWMRLMQFDSSLFNFYLNWYLHHIEKLESSYLNTQLYSNFLLFSPNI